MKNKAIIGLCIGLGVAIFFLYKGCGGQRSAEGMYKASQDSLKLTRDSENRQSASISILEGLTERALQDLETKDSTILWLKGVAKDFEGKLNSATVFSTATNTTGTTSTFVTETDTFWKDSVAYVYPTYETSWENRWEIGSIVAKYDSIFRDIKVKNEFEFTQGMESQGWFKKRQLRVTVKNLNPNTETEELRTFTVNRNKGNRFGLNMNVTYGIGPDGIARPSIGFGIGYRILSF